MDLDEQVRVAKIEIDYLTSDNLLKASFGDLALLKRLLAIYSAELLGYKSFFLEGFKSAPEYVFRKTFHSLKNDVDAFKLQKTAQLLEYMTHIEPSACRALLNRYGMEVCQILFSSRDKIELLVEDLSDEK